MCPKRIQMRKGRFMLLLLGGLFLGCSSDDQTANAEAEQAYSFYVVANPGPATYKIRYGTSSSNGFVAVQDVVWVKDSLVSSNTFHTGTLKTKEKFVFVDVSTVEKHEDFDLTFSIETLVNDNRQGHVINVKDSGQFSFKIK